jgi:glutathione S-transferase
MSKYVLYSMPASLYSAKVRAYMRKLNIPHTERANGHPAYQQQVVPAIGRMIVPVLETPDGKLIQDSIAIIDYLEAAEPREHSIYPQTAKQLAVGHLFEIFGGEGLMRPAMHYRWNFDKENLAFLKEDLPGFIAAGADAKTRSDFFEFASGLMRKATVALGVSPHLIPQVEASYAEFLQLFSAHLRTAPYLLGGLPSNGDFALAGPLWPHLARDPYPAGLMQRTAWPVYRWTERIASPVNDTGEYIDCPEEFFADDSIPETLVELMKYVAAEMLPELAAQVGFMDEHLAADPEITDGSVVGGKPSRRSIGKVTFEWRGQEMTTSVLPYRVFLLQRLQAAVAGRSEAERAEIEALFATCGLEVLLTLKPRRTVERRDNCEVWGGEQAAQLQAP